MEQGWGTCGNVICMAQYLLVVFVKGSVASSQGVFGTIDYMTRTDTTKAFDV